MRERRGLYYMVSVHQKVHFPPLMTCPGAQPLWVVTRWYTNPTCVDCDYLLVIERGEAQGTRRQHLVICGKGMWRLIVLSISLWVWNFFKQKIIFKKRSIKWKTNKLGKHSQQIGHKIANILFKKELLPIQTTTTTITWHRRTSTDIGVTEIETQISSK